MIADLHDVNCNKLWIFFLLKYGHEVEGLKKTRNGKKSAVLAMASWHEQDGRVLHRAPLLAIIKAYVLDARVSREPGFFLSFFADIPIGDLNVPTCDSFSTRNPGSLEIALSEFPADQINMKEIIHAPRVFLVVSSCSSNYHCLRG
mgnify:CR=1 FL=1